MEHVYSVYWTMRFADSLMLRWQDSGGVDTHTNVWGVWDNLWEYGFLDVNLLDFHDNVLVGDVDSLCFCCLYDLVNFSNL